MIDDARFAERGFLPAQDPLCAFAADSPYTPLSEWGQRLPEWLQRDDFRARVEKLPVPAFREPLTAATLPALRLYYLRLAFLASGYVNQVGQPPVHRLPANLARPLCRACRLLGRPPILSYDGYALYNWYRLDPGRPVALGNIDTIQNFVPLYDEHWFILVHVEIEALAAPALGAILGLAGDGDCDRTGAVDRAIEVVTATVQRQTAVLRRIPERMSPDLYFCRFRPYIRFFEDVTYEGTALAPMNYRGETGAQSSVLPALEAFLKIPHRASLLTEHLRDLRRYMPQSHQRLLQRIEAMPPVREVASAGCFNAALEAIARFREVHYDWARLYVDSRVADPRGTGGTPYMQWLGQLIDETRACAR